VTHVVRAGSVLVDQRARVLQALLDLPAPAITITG
jgi:hypothetical protein